MTEKENKDKYHQLCMERRHTLTPIVYSLDRIPGTEAISMQQRLDLLFRNNLKQEHS